MSSQVLALFSSLALAGCGMCGSAPSTEAPVTTPTAAVADPTATETPTLPEARLPRPDLRIVFQHDPFGRRELRVENRGDSPAPIRSWVGLESSEGGDYSVMAPRLHLGRGGDAAALVTPTDTVECVELIGGAALILAPWNFVTRPANCPAEAQQTLAAGTYRYIVQSCDEQHEFPSSPFVLSEEDLPPNAPCAGPEPSEVDPDVP